MEYTHVSHTFGPIYNKDSRILILGSFPSVKSRKGNFYYGHPQNRFWKVLSQIQREECPVTIEEKKAFLLRNHIAIWDVIESCDIIGSSDSSIKNVVPNDMKTILKGAGISAIFTNGDKAFKLFQKFCIVEKELDLPPVVKLPSTSPANAAYQLDRLVTIWETSIQQYLTEFHN